MRVEGRRRTVYSGASGKNAGLELQGYSYAKDFDAVVFLLFSIFFFVPNFEVGSGPPGEHGLSRGGQQNPEAALAPPRFLPHWYPPACTRPVGVDSDPRRAGSRWEPPLGQVGTGVGQGPSWA